MNIFVLTTGRSGSKTFAEACRHLHGWTAGHETQARRLWPRDYPPNHVEVDNRLVWFLGQLGEAYAGRDVLYVHLKRDAEATALSFWRHSMPTAERPVAYPASELRAFAHGLVMRPDIWADYLPVARALVEAKNANIREFLRGRSGRAMTVHLEDGGSTFRIFLDRIGAEGADRDAALAEWGVKHNEGPK